MQVSAVDPKCEPAVFGSPSVQTAPKNLVFGADRFCRVTINTAISSTTLNPSVHQANAIRVLLRASSGADATDRNSVLPSATNAAGCTGASA